MRLLPLILFFGVCHSHWTTLVESPEDDYLLVISGQNVLQKILTMAEPSYVDLSTLRLTQISEDAFDDVPNITILDLSNNDLMELPQNFFSKLNNLQELSSAHNLFSSVARLFVGLNKLKRLDLSNNLIKILSPGDFFGLTPSVNIITEGNEIEYLSSRIFQDLPFDSERYGYFQKEYKDMYEPIFDNIEVKLCRNVNGSVKVVKVVESHQPLDDCIRVPVSTGKRRLVLSYLGLETFELHWYTLPADFVSEIDLSHNLISDITPELLNHLPSGLSAICLDFNNIRKISSNVINNRFLKKFYLRFNPLHEIAAEAFAKTSLTTFLTEGTSIPNLDFVRTLPKTLEYFIFDNNSISEIHKNIFQSFENLKSIILRFNSMENIEFMALADQENLIELDLSNNLFCRLTPGVFKGLKKLKKLDFTHNKFERILQNTFSELRNLTDLEIRLGYDNINTIEEGSFSNMKIAKLVLSSNRITDESIAMGAFDKLTVNYLNLSGNSLTKINGEIFKGISSVYTLELSENQIKTIEKGATMHLNNVRSLDLRGNPLEQLGNGAFYGLSKDEEVAINLRGSPIKLIQGGVFDNV